MNKNEHLKKAPKGAGLRADWHRADIKAALEKAGWSLRRLSAHHGYAETALRHALSTPYPRAEEIIAAAIGVEPWAIWPSRYEDGVSLHGHDARRRRARDRRCHSSPVAAGGKRSEEVRA